MKKIFMMAVMAVAALSANAQNEKGQFTLMPKAGINISTVTGDGPQKSKVGFVGGLEAEYGIAKNFGLAFGALYSMEGCKYPADNFVNGLGGNINFNLGYINIPILAQLYVVKGLALKAGLQPAFNVTSKWSEDGVSVKSKDLGFEAKSFNLSIPVGISYEIKNFVLDARYNIGTTRLYKDQKGNNSTFSITLGYKFAL